jgi:hypothetical protein
VAGRGTREEGAGAASVSQSRESRVSQPTASRLGEERRGAAGDSVQEAGTVHHRRTWAPGASGGSRSKSWRRRHRGREKGPKGDRSGSGRARREEKNKGLRYNPVGTVAPKRREMNRDGKIGRHEIECSFGPGASKHFLASGLLNIFEIYNIVI